MGSLYVAWQFEALARGFARRLASLRRTADPFAPLLVVTPSRVAKAWLQLFVARESGACANVRWCYLEEAIWSMLRGLDASGSRVERLTVDELRAMIVSVFLRPHDRDDALRPFLDYLGESEGTARAFQRKVRQLADRLARFFEDYEFHRRDLLARWLGAEDLSSANCVGDIEAAQCALYRMLVAKGGLRDRLDAATGVRRLTLGEYAASLLSVVPRPTARPPVLLFGLSHVSPLHADLLRGLGDHYDLDVFLHTPLAPRAATAHALLRLAVDEPQLDAHDPIAQWGRSATRSLLRLAPMLSAGGLRFELLADVETELAPAGGTLRALQDRVLGRPQDARVGADGSLRVVACPSTFREAEAVYQDVLKQLASDPTLRPADVAVLVPDMADYHAPLWAAFAADKGGAIPFAIRDVSLRDASHYARGVEQLLELADGRFPRAGVCELFLNPCFLARLGTDLAEAERWVAWARKLNVCHSFDESCKATGGYFGSPAFTWDLALRRLRLGYLFERFHDDGDDAMSEAFGGAVPFADMEAGEAEAAGRFCEVVERLHRGLDPLRKRGQDAAAWGGELRRLFDDFLAVPADAPGEAGVRRKVHDALDELAALDGVRAALGAAGPLGLALVRQHLLDSVSDIAGVVGRRQPGGVTICELPSVRPLSFKLVYVLGLGEGEFPGQAAATVLDLVAREARPADIASPDLNRQLFLDAILAARARLWLSYVSRDLQKDRPLYPSSVLSQLVRQLDEHVLSPGSFRVVELPLSGTDPVYLKPNGGAGDLVNFSLHDRVACLLRLRAEGRIDLNGELTEKARSIRPDFAAPRPAAGGTDARPVVAVHLSQLKAFLRNPVTAAVQRHLGLREDEAAPPGDDEPFFSGTLDGWRCREAALRWFVAEALSRGVDGACAGLEAYFHQYFAGCQRVGRAPEGAFGDIDRDRLLAEVRAIVGDIGDPEDERLARHLDARGGATNFIAATIGAARAGQGRTPLRFPALKLDLPGDRQAQLSGVGGPIFFYEGAVEVLCPPTKQAIRPGGLTHHAIEPFLFLLALRAGSEPGEDGLDTSAGWAGDRPMRLCLPHSAGVAVYDLGRIDPAEARAELGALCREYVGQPAFGHLPFDTIVEVGPGDGLAARLRAALDAQPARRSRGVARSEDLLSLIAPQVPDDASEVVARRLGRLFDAAATGGGAAAGGGSGDD